MSDLYGGFEKLLREDHMIIKEASSRQLWHDMEDDGSNIILSYVVLWN